MGLKDHIRRFEAVGEEYRQDLQAFIREGKFEPSTEENIKIPVKIVDLPEIAYDPIDKGGVGMAGDADAQPDQGQPVEVPGEPQQGEGDDEGDDEAGEEGEAHSDYYDMDPEEFAQELDDELELELEPKGKQVAEETEGPLKDVTERGTRSTLMLEEWFTEGLKRKLATEFDEEYVREALKVDGWGADEVFAWARENNITVSYDWVAEAAEEVAAEEQATWERIEEMEDHVEYEPVEARVRREGIEEVPLRREDQQFRHPEIQTEYEKNVVVVNIRDVSGSMRQQKRELVERTFVPLDWYLTGKYEEAAFIYIAHNAEAWEVRRDEFFRLESGGGTQISSGYEVAQQLLEEEYPWAEWNRYVFAAGDGENRTGDTTENVIPMMEELDANLHGYVETQPGSSARSTHGEELRDHFDEGSNVAITEVNTRDDVIGAIETILSTEDSQ
ncbi:MAG: DUF444 family protein [Halolamina sp.]|uniref:DUF444 family protein n=1 Tax=Halolamina sp. TaxID=1940283 RepID=UPI002FC2A7D3